MQPDNARPTANNPRITFNDDMAHVPIDNLAFRSNKCCTKNATIPLIPLSAKRRG
jgi:hypothetical protein